MADPKPAAPKLVPVRLADGAIGTVPEADLTQAIESGAEVVSDEVLQRAKLEHEYGGLKGEALAGAAGAARGLTLGLSDVALTELDPSLRDPLSALKTVNPNASLAGEIAGAVAPTLVTGGAGAAKAGLSVGSTIRGLGALPRGVNALGGLAERGAARLVGEGATGVLGAAAQRGVALGARGATEGLFVGAGEQVSEMALSDAGYGDADAIAQRLMAGAQRGALAGLAIGGGLGVLEGGGFAAIGQLRTKLDAARARKGGEIATKLDDSADMALSKGTGEITPSQVPQSVVEKYADSFENAEQLANAWKNRAKLFARHDDTLEAATRTVANDLSNAVKAERVVDMASFGEAKASQMARLIPDSTMAARVTQREAAIEAVGTVRAKLDELAAAGGGDAKVAMKRLGDKVALVEKRLDTKSASDLFMELDNLKRAVGREAGAGGKAFGLSEGQRLFRETYEDLRLKLEKEDVWGAAGAAQRDLNEATAKRLATRDAFKRDFLADYDKQGFVQMETADPAKVEGFIRNLTSARNDLKQQSLLDYVQRERDFLERVEKHYTLSAGEKAQAAQARAAFTQIEKSLGDTAKSVSEVNAARRLIEEEKAFALGGISGAVVDVFTRPMTTLARLADIERAVHGVEKRIDKGVGVFFKKPQAPIAITGKAEPLRDAYTKRVAEVAELAADPAKVAAKMADRIGDLADHAPNVSASAAGLEAKKVAFLQSKIPVGHKPTDGLQPHLARPRVSDLEMARFMRYARAADDPMTIVTDLEHGRVTREAVETVRELYPAVYESVRARVLEQLSSAKERVPYAKQIQIGILFDAKTHPSLEPAFIRAMQEQWSAKQQQQPPSAIPSRPFSLGQGGAGATAAERIEGR